MNNSKATVVDVTMRDGGLVNNFRFTDSFVKALIRANQNIGVDVMELGYKASKSLFSADDFGQWKFCSDDTLSKIINSHPNNLKFSAMADVGRTDVDNDIADKKNSILDIIRVAAYLPQYKEAISMIEKIKNKGYTVTCNIMAISNHEEPEIKNALTELAQTSVDCIYIVDSYGSLYPKDIARLTDIYTDSTYKYEKSVGIHAHNNQQLAFANTISAFENGASWLDASVNGMGRGAGNCMLEMLIPYLNDPRFNYDALIEFIDGYSQFMKSDGNIWGYDKAYLLTGVFNQHPRSAIDFTENNRTDYWEFYNKIKKGI